MNYFILNNNFHFSYLTKYFNEKLIDSTLLINKHNYEINHQERSIEYNILIFTNPVQTYKDFLKVNLFFDEYNQIIKKISKVNENDTLYILSEQDFLNLKIINFFLERKAKLILLEDGTFTPVYLTIPNNHLLVRKIHTYIINFLFYNYAKKKLNISHTKMNFLYNTPVYKFYDNLYTKAFITSNYNLNRRINQIQIIEKSINNINNKIKFINNIIIFVNSPHNLEIGDKYFRILRRALNNILIEYGCNKIIFCFHPRESNLDKIKIKNALKGLDNIDFEIKLNTKDVILNYSPKYVISFMSTSLLEFNSDLFHAIFLIDKYPEIIFPALSKKMSEYIMSLDI